MAISISFGVRVDRQADTLTTDRPTALHGHLVGRKTYSYMNRNIPNESKEVSTLYDRTTSRKSIYGHLFIKKLYRQLYQTLADYPARLTTEHFICESSKVSYYLQQLMYMHKPFAYVSNSLIGIYTVSEKK